PCDHQDHPPRISTHLFLLLPTPPPPTPTLFPYTTLFRSHAPIRKYHVYATFVNCNMLKTAASPANIPTSAPRAFTPRSKVPSRKDRKSTRLNSSHLGISYAVFCLKKKKKHNGHSHSSVTP